MSRLLKSPYKYIEELVTQLWWENEENQMSKKGSKRLKKENDFNFKINLDGEK